jgi:hypothetical protein
MTAPQFMDRARQLDADIMALDRRYVIARVNDAPDKTLQKMRAQRDALVRKWAEAWGARRVEP